VAFWGGSPATPVSAKRLAAARSVSAPPPDPRSDPTTTRISVAATGDVLIHEPVWRRALALGRGGHYDFRPMLRAVRPVIRRADLGLCHVETPMAAGPPRGYPVFRTPPALARAIAWAGYDVCDTASNHSLDDGQSGIDTTGRALDRFHIMHTGSFSSPAARRRVTIRRVKGIPVAILAYTASTNGFRAPHPWSLNLADPRRIVSDAHRARRAGARVVIVNLHWGDEFRGSLSAEQSRLARRLARAKAITAIVGQHVHVVQPIRRIDDTVVVFGEGNLLSNQTAACCPAATQDGIIALLTIDVRGTTARVSRVRYVPTWVRHPDFTVLPVTPALRGGWADRAQLLASYRRTLAAAGHSVAQPAAIPGR